LLIPQGSSFAYSARIKLCLFISLIVIWEYKQSLILSASRRIEKRIP